MNACRILVVEDEAVVALDIQERLAGMGYQLAGLISSGEQALALIEQQKPNLVLMDIRLSGPMDGIAVAEEIHRRFYLPVVFLTAYSEDATLDRAKLTEPFGYILKPFHDRELKSTIEIALYKHRAEEEIRRMNRLYNVLSHVNQAVVHISEREKLLSTICRVMVEEGRMDLAWIGEFDPASSRVKPLTHFGLRSEGVGEPLFPTHDWLEGQDEVGRIIREGQSFVCDPCGDGPRAPFLQWPASFAFHSCGSFPIRFQGQARYVLNVYITEPGFFQERELDLLNEVAMDLSFALDKLESDAQRERLDEELRRFNVDLEQRVRERTAQLEIANKELEGFSYSVSHDLRAPLRHLVGFVNLLNEQASDALNEESRHYLKVISDSAARMGELVDDLLSFSRMGRVELMRTLVPMDRLVRDVLEAVQPDLHGREIAWSLGRLPDVHGDPSLLKMVMVNLISNAIKFTGRKPHAVIEIGSRSDHVEEEIIYVKDNGAGFDMNYADKLFGLFQRLHRMEEFEGTGLGLANVHRIICRHGGRTWAEGVVDQGATFYFSLPKRKEQ